MAKYGTFVCNKFIYLFKETFKTLIISFGNTILYTSIAIYFDPSNMNGNDGLSTLKLLTYSHVSANNVTHISIIQNVSPLFFFTVLIHVLTVSTLLSINTLCHIWPIFMSILIICFGRQDRIIIL